MKEWLSGRNPIYETLRAHRRQPFRLWVAQGVEEKGRLTEILGLASACKLPVEYVPRARLDSLTANHQGVALEASEYPYCDLTDILERAAEQQEFPFVLILDTLQDPQNLGTLLRTAEAVGVHGILLPFRRTATITPAVVHASSGACEHLLITQTNLAQAIATLKQKGLWIVGLESSVEASHLAEVQLDGPLALVVGSEGEGMRALVRKSCDFLLRLPMRGQIESLNAAVAGSIVLYFAWRERLSKNLNFAS